MIHSTLTDAEGNKYKIVASWWLRLLTALCVIEFIILILILAGLIDNVRRVETAMQYSERVAQRSLALGDIASSRAKANIWAFNQSCDYAKKNGHECPTPTWYADPKKYPLIADSIEGVGLFPPKEEEK